MAAGAVAAARGSLLGLALGDAIGATAGLVPESGLLAATSGGQLACFTVDGLIRADVHGSLYGEGRPASFVWRAYGRWAAMQGILPADSNPRPGGDPRGHGASGSAPDNGAGSTPGQAGSQSAAEPGRVLAPGDDPADRWPDGWLADVPSLREARGTAPATLAALRARAESPDGPAPRSSLGPRAVTRTLPVGLYAHAGRAAHLAAEIAALTHRGTAITAAAVGAMTVQLLSEGAPLEQAVTAAEEQASRLGHGTVPADVAEAMAAARSAPRDAAQLGRFAGEPSASAALAGGLYVAASFPDRETICDALLFAAASGDGGHAATVTGALLGAAHGPDALPVGWLSRLELVWVTDTLARDLVRQLSESPAGTEYTSPTDPHWWARYPGW